MNYNGPNTPNKPGIYYQNGSDTELPLITTSSKGDELIMSIPNNGINSSVRIKPKAVSAVDSPSYVLLTKPDGSVQVVESDFTLSEGKTLTTPSLNVVDTLYIQNSTGPLKNFTNSLVVEGPALFSNNAVFTGSLFGLNGSNGILYDPFTRTISSNLVQGNDYWNLAGNTLSNKSGSNLSILGTSNFGGISNFNNTLNASNVNINGSATIMNGNLVIGKTTAGGILDIEQNGNGGLNTLITNNSTGSNAYCLLQFKTGNARTYFAQNSENRSGDGYYGAFSIKNQLPAGNIHLQRKQMYSNGAKYTTYGNGEETVYSENYEFNGGGVIIGEQPNGLVYPASRLYVDYGGSPNGCQHNYSWASNVNVSLSLNFMSPYSCLGPSVYSNLIYFYSKDEVGNKRGLGLYMGFSLLAT